MNQWIPSSAHTGVHSLNSASLCVNTVVYYTFTFSLESQPRTSCFLALLRQPGAHSLLLLCDPVSVRPSAARLCGACCTIRCLQNGLFYHLSLWQLSPRHPHTCTGRYMTLLMPHCEAVRISDWDGQESRPSTRPPPCCSAETLMGGEPEVSSQVRRVQGVMEICQECTLSLTDIQTEEYSYNLCFKLTWRTAKSFGHHALFLAWKN